jgi:hypothetical protein
MAEYDIEEYKTPEEIKEEKAYEALRLRDKELLKDLYRHEGFWVLLQYILGITGYNNHARLFEDQMSRDFNLGAASVFPSLMEVLDEIDPEIYPKLLIRIVGEHDARSKN